VLDDSQLADVPHLPDIDDQVILMLSNPVARSNHGPSPSPKRNHGLGLINILHGPTHDIFSKKLYNDRLSFLHCCLLR
jgi:hypothetical protein